jgi:large subunit ribosomal protein L21
MYAVIKTGGKQYRVAPGGTIRIERLAVMGAGCEFRICSGVHTEDKKVLSGSDLQAKVTEDRAAGTLKSHCAEFKKTNQYKISRGHRQNYTAVQVSDISL